jgi:hypothetical protein
MKSALKILFSAPLHPLWFILACLLLAAVMVGALVMAARVSWVIDGTIEQASQPMPTRLPAKPSGALLPVALDSLK